MTSSIFEVPVLDDGDVNARVWIRIREVEQSLALIEQILARLPDGRDRGRRAARPARPAKAWVSSKRFRGDVLVWVRLDGEHDRALPSARSVLVPVAAAGSRDRGQHRRRLPALQQIVQLLLFGARSLRVIVARWAYVFGRGITVDWEEGMEGDAQPLLEGSSRR